MDVTIDVAGALQAHLNARGHNASAWPLPADLAERLPFTRITALGSTRTDMVVDRHRVQVETWAETSADALGEAHLVEAELLALARSTLGGVPCYSVTLTSGAHDADDPYHQDLCVAESFAEVVTRVAHVI